MVSQRGLRRRRPSSRQALHLQSSLIAFFDCPSRRSSVIRPISTHSTTTRFPDRSKQVPWGVTNLPCVSAPRVFWMMTVQFTTKDSRTTANRNDARAALERLQGFYQTTGRKASLLAGILEYCESARKLNGRTLIEAVRGYLSTAAPRSK